MGWYHGLLAGTVRGGLACHELLAGTVRGGMVPWAAGRNC